MDEVVVKTRLGIFGAGGHAKVIVDAVKRQRVYEPTSFYDDEASRCGAEHYCGLTIRGNFDCMIQDLQSKYLDAAIIAIGNNEIRTELGEYILTNQLPLATVIDPHAVMSPTATIGCGTVIVGGAVINADVRIGAHVIINTAASVDHDCVIEDGVHIAPHATLCGNVRIGREALIGANATIIPNLEFPSFSTLAAGTTLTKSVRTSGVHFGR